MVSESVLTPTEIKVRAVIKPGYFGIGAFSKSTMSIGCELNERGTHNTGLSESERVHFEKALGLKEFDLKPTSKWWGDVFNVEHVIRLRRDKTNLIPLDTEINQLKYKVLLASSKVANTELEKNKPGVLFFIDDVESRVKKENETLNFEMEGMKLIFSSTPEEKRGNLRLFGHKGTDSMSENNLNSELAKELKRDPKKFFDIMTDKDLKEKVFIKELEEFHILSRKSGSLWHKEVPVGANFDEAIDFFNDPENVKLKLKLQNDLKNFKKKSE